MVCAQMLKLTRGSGEGPGKLIYSTHTLSLWFDPVEGMRGVF